jgi:TonB-linked SusC/RagA family outer membrane protein
MDRRIRLIGVAGACFLMLMAGIPDLLAQQTKRTITGVVKSDGQTLPGVTVVEKGTNNGTVTDVEGAFSLPINDGSTLVFSFIGMKPQEVAISGQTHINVTMESDVTQLNDVVVVGYGTVERKDLTSSVSSINAKQLADIPINNAGQALAGRLAGVQIVTSEGTPNAQVQVRVRGGGSITQDNTPLYVVDGIQVENALSVLAPQDIATIDVLKDASATAIYGARGANGVVIITTKGGREQKMQVTYNGLVGVRKLANKLNVMNPYDFVMYQYERSRGNASAENTFRNTYGNFNDLELYKQVPFVDWQEESFGRVAVQQTHNISVTGGSAKTQYNVSLTANGEDGVQLNSDFNRRLITTRLDHKFTNWLKAGANFRYNNTVVNGAGTSASGSSSTNRLRQSIRYRPLLFPGTDTETYDPNYAQETNSNSLALVNPVLLASAEYQKDVSTVVNVNGYIVVDPTPYLSFRSSLGYDITNRHVNAFSDTITNNSKQNGQGLPVASIDSSRQTILNNSNVVTFSLHKLSEQFAKLQKLDVLLGHEIYQTSFTTHRNETHGFPRGTTPDLAFSSMEKYTPYTNPSYPTQDVTSRLLSFFGRAAYSYNDKYMVTLTMRADGSSKFSEGHKWGYFPSTSFAWRLSNEKFFQDIQSATRISDLKIRVSYGQSGNNRINDFLYLQQFELYPPYELNGQPVLGFGPKRDGGNPALANSNLRWETTISRNVGIDIGVLEGRANMSIDIYNNTTQDLIVNAPVPTSSGYLNQLQNVGSTTNRGVEIQLNGVPVQNRNFSWRANFNISFNNNNIDNLGRQNAFLFNSGWANNSPFDYSVAVGQPTGTIWGLKTDGFYQIDDFTYDATSKKYTLKPGVANDQTITSIAPAPGVIKYKDLNGDGVVNDNDRTGLGSANPTFFGGFNNQFTYKNFDLSLFINFQYGNKVLNANKLEFTSGYTTNANLLSMMNNRFRNVNAEGQVVTDPDALRALNANATLWTPLLSASSFYVNDWAVEDGSFIRINNVTLGYNISKEVLQKFKLTKFRIYATANNLAVFTNYSGYDPDVNTRRASPITPGVDYSAYPRSRAYIVGVNVSF